MGYQGPTEALLNARAIARCPSCCPPTITTTVPPTPTKALIATHNQGGYADAWAFNSATGFGSKYSAPGTPIPGISHSVDFTTGGGAVIFSHTTSPCVSAYVWQNGYGTQYTQPSVLPTYGSITVAAFGASFTPQDDAVVLAHTADGTNPIVTGYQWDAVAGFGTKLTWSTTSLGSITTSNCIGFNPTGTYVAFGGSSTSPRVYVSPWSSNTGFGGKLADPATPPTGQIRDVTFSPNGNNIATTHTSSPYVTAYPFNAGFGAKFANPSSLPGSGANPAYSVAWSRDGAYILVGTTPSPYIFVYPWSDSTGFGAKLADPATLPDQYVTGIEFTIAGDAVMMSEQQSSSPCAIAYVWSNGLGTRYAAPVSYSAGATGSSIAASPVL